MRSVLATLSLAAGLFAQQPLLDISLAADPGKTGPSAWTWLRSECLTSLPEWPEEKDPLSSLRLRVYAANQCEVIDGTPGDGLYLRAEAHPSPACHIEITCKFSGVETWDLEGVPSGRYAMLVNLLGLDRGRTPVTFDSLAVASTILGGTVDGDELGRLINWGAEACGELDLHFWKTETGIRIRGASQGGMLLPAALTVLADWHAHPAESLLQAGRKIDRCDQVILLAAAARYDERSEAIRQLSILDDPRVIPVLERLLREDDQTRVLTMESLVRAKVSKALPRLLAASSDSIDGSEAMARVALWTLWPSTSPSTRQQIRDHLDPLEASALDAWHLEGKRPQPPRKNQASTAKANASSDLHFAAWIGMWITLGTLGMMYFRTRQST